jgi:hypothetical protein
MELDKEQNSRTDGFGHKHALNMSELASLVREACIAETDLGDGA